MRYEATCPAGCGPHNLTAVKGPIWSVRCWTCGHWYSEETMLRHMRGVVPISERNAPAFRVLDKPKKYRKRSEAAKKVLG